MKVNLCRRHQFARIENSYCHCDLTSNFKYVMIMINEFPRRGTKIKHSTYLKILLRLPVPARYFAHVERARDYPKF